MELAMVIHDKVYSGIHFFRGKDKSFISWMSTSLKRVSFQKDDYIYKEGDDANDSKAKFFSLVI